MLRRVFHSTQMPPVGFNRGHYSNPEVDRLIDLAGAATTEAERKKYYSEVQKIVAEDAPYISLWNRTNVAVAQPTLTGLHLNAVGRFRSAERRHENPRFVTTKSRDPSTHVVRRPGPAERLRPREADPAPSA